MNKLVSIGIVLGILFAGIGLVYGLVDFDYQKLKCDNLKSTISEYDFDYKIELDADYNERCYHLKNHPFAILGYTLGHMLGGVMVAFIVTMLIFFVKFTREHSGV